ncbi:MAG: FAD-binding oxidoreductase [Gemmatimonadaceae bacterium]|nr:FAD-binding oxidoreductase [Gloeobacterales cyanobacterium ES-bin-141]
MTDTQALSRQSPLVQALAHGLQGRIVLPSDADYDDLRKPWLQVVDQHPALIVEAASVADIVAAVNFARTERLVLAVMSTGHGIAAPCDNGLLLHLSKMKQISVDVARRVAQVLPGVTSDELLAATQPHGLVYAAGQVSGVGVIGYTLGGGMGWLVRKLGAASWAVLGANVVLANGSVVHASADTNPDLFWALRGGGGNFGVVVSLEMALEPIPAVVGGELYYPLDQAADLLRFYREWSSGLPDETSTIFRLLAIPPDDSSPPEIRGKTNCMIGLCHSDTESADAVLEPLYRFRKPLLNTVKRQTVLDLAGLDLASHSPGSPTYGQVEFLKALSDDVIDGLVQLAQTRIPPLMQIEVQQLGGALVHGATEQGAFTPSAAPYLLHLVTPAIKAPMAEIAKATQEAFASLGDAYTGEAYYNFLRGDEQQRVTGAFGDTKYGRLREIKSRFDPANSFHLNLNIEPASLSTTVRAEIFGTKAAENS